MNDRDKPTNTDTSKVQNKKTEDNTIKSQEPSWMEIAIDFPVFKVIYYGLDGTGLYTVDIKEIYLRKPRVRNMDFEVVYPLYNVLNDIIEKRKTSKTTTIKVEASSREHNHVTYDCEFSPDKWSYTTMDAIMDALADQLTMKKNLNRGLLMKILRWPIRDIKTQLFILGNLNGKTYYFRSGVLFSYPYFFLCKSPRFFLILKHFLKLRGFF